MKIVECIQTKNASYIVNRKIKPVGIVFHSTAANNPNLKRYVDCPEEFGVNKYNNHWNKPNAKKSMHGFIGKDKNGEIVVAHTLPYDIACWGAGGGVNGSYNYDPQAHIQFEFCEDNLKNEKYYRDGVAIAEDYCVHLCKLLDIKPDRIVGHYEAANLGYASDHSDPQHWMKLYNDSMSKFRDRVAQKLSNVSENESEQTVSTAQISKHIDVSGHKVNLKITRDENAEFFNKPVGTVIALDLEEYLLGVVPAEIGNPHIEAGKAQAIVARTYAYISTRNGNVIDDTTSYQAYRAPRSTNKAYSTSHNAVKETAGQMLYYNDSVIDTAVYSHSNGGQMTSAKERWGSEREYLTSGYDPWTTATGEKKRGHGVGLSQVGAVYAADNGTNHEVILTFYYPGTVILPKIADAPKTPEFKTQEPEHIFKAIVKTRLPLSLNIWRDTRKSKSLAKVPRGDEVYVIDLVDGTWARIQYKGFVGYVDRKYLIEPLGAGVLYRAKVVTRQPLSLNVWKDVRKSASLTKVPKGATIDVLKEVNKTWAKVRFGKHIGYCDRRYLRKI